jgi:hypothetical protein
MKVIKRNTLIWPKKLPEKIKKLDKLFYILGNEMAFHFFIGILGFRPSGSGTWKRYDWARFLKGYIFDVMSIQTGEEKMIEEFNRVFYRQGIYFHWLDNEWYV